VTTRPWRIIAAVALIGALAAVTILPSALDAGINRVLRDPPYEASERARELFSRLFVADLHADSLLWQRDLGQRGGRGHVDIPRLIEGNVALEAFTIVTRVPWGLNLESNASDARDLVTMLVVLERWPRPTWTSLTERALHQARKLAALAEERDDFSLIRSRGDLVEYMHGRVARRDVTAGFLGIEGAHALDGDLANLERLYEAGIRMIAPTHFFDNALGGSAHGEEKGGLTALGREMITRMEQLGIVLDLAHASPATIDDALAVATAPIVVSHTGVKGTCEGTRNLSDAHVEAIARTGGVIGIGFWEAAVCGTDARAIARAIRYTVDRVGADHVGLGSDFDGAVATPFDATGLVQIVDALLAEGLSEGDVGKIMGGNTARVLAQILPRG